MEEKFQINIAICDDDPVMLTRLEALCKQILQNTYSIFFSLSQDPAQCLRMDRIYNIALLDVELLHTTGIQLARQLLEKNPDCRILFVSSYVHVVTDVYAVPHFCFVLKEQLEEKLPPYLRQAAEMCAQDGGRMLSVKSGKSIETFFLSRITFLERRGHYTFITLSSGEVRRTTEKLSSLQSRMGCSSFVRCHISYLVNLRYVRSIENRIIRLDSGIQIPISLPHQQQVQDSFFRYLEK